MVYGIVIRYQFAPQPTAPTREQRNAHEQVLRKPGMMARSVALLLPRGSRWMATRPKSHGAGGGHGALVVMSPRPRRVGEGPGATSGLMDFLRSTTGEIGPVLRGMREEDRRPCPYRIWPEEGGW